MRRLIIFGIALYALFILRQFPADVALAWFSPQSVTVHNASGSVWSGEAQAIETNVPGLTLGQTSWQISPLWLLTGRVRGEINSRFADSAIRTGFSKPFIGSGLKLSNANGIVTLDTLPKSLLPMPAEGRVGVSFDRLVLKNLWPHAVAGTVDLVDLAVVQGQRIELGSFEILFDGEQDTQGAVTGTVADTDSTLTVSGYLTLGNDRTYLFEGFAKASAQTPSDIADGLQFLGTPDADGNVALSFAGTIE